MRTVSVTFKPLLLCGLGRDDAGPRETRVPLPQQAPALERLVGRQAAQGPKNALVNGRAEALPQESCHDRPTQPREGGGIYDLGLLTLDALTAVDNNDASIPTIPGTASIASCGMLSRCGLGLCQPLELGKIRRGKKSRIRQHLPILLGNAHRWQRSADPPLARQASPQEMIASPAVEKSPSPSARWRNLTKQIAFGRCRCSSADTWRSGRLAGCNHKLFRIVTLHSQSPGPPNS